MDVKKIKLFRERRGKDFAIFFIFLSIGLIIGSLLRDCGRSKEDKKDIIQTHVIDPVSDYTILQEFGTRASDFSNDKKWIDNWGTTGYFGVINTIIIKKSTGDTINNIACIVREKEYLRSVKQDMYDGAVDIIEATEEFDNIKTD